MSNLKTNIAREEKATKWMWDTTNSNSGSTGYVYKYKITNDGYDLDAEVQKYELDILDYPNLMMSPIQSVYQESKVRDFKSDKYTTLILEKYKADKLLSKGQGNLYSNFCKDAVVTFRITDQLLEKSNLTVMNLPSCSSSDLNNSKRKKEVYLIPVRFGSKKSY